MSRCIFHVALLLVQHVFGIIFGEIGSLNFIMVVMVITSGSLCNRLLSDFILPILFLEMLLVFRFEQSRNYQLII